MKKTIILGLILIFIFGCSEIEDTPIESTENKKVYYLDEFSDKNESEFTEEELDAFDAWFLIRAYMLDSKYKTDKEYMLYNCIESYMYDFGDKEFEHVTFNFESYKKVTELKNKYYQVGYSYKVGDSDYLFLFEIDLIEADISLHINGYYDLYAGNSNAKIILKRFNEVYSNPRLYMCEYQEYDMLENTK